ncbi:aldo/keto reductase [Flavisphingomonas formosensis]|uniref:aldo/keto reductase n=1 Tax=Flavisphingomonas formosensis TaxID=861534 RepID=UPI0012F898FF|nr:aldo/keto reductase [Sphingomonas formosensis]
MVAKRKVGPFEVVPIGLGCMSLSSGYGAPPAEADAETLLHRALDLGYDFLDTSSIYGIGHNETLIGRALKGRREQFILASKCGIHSGEGGRRVIDCRPETVTRVIDESLQRLGLDHIDLYYLHRPDPQVPIEDSVGALVRAIETGKIGSIGLSEMSAETLHRAAAVHPIAAMQTEYSLWTRNPEIAVLDACRQLGTTFVAFSPVGRGFLADGTPQAADLRQGDIRYQMPRFVEPNYSRNLEAFGQFRAIAAEVGKTPAQLALAWLLHVEPSLVTIPGTTSIPHLEENFAALDVVMTDDLAARLDATINRETIFGRRYTPSMQALVGTEEFA